MPAAGEGKGTGLFRVLLPWETSDGGQDRRHHEGRPEMGQAGLCGHRGAAVGFGPELLPGGRVPVPALPGGQGGAIGVHL